MRIMILSLLTITVLGCQTSVYRTHTPIPGNKIYIGTLHCKDKAVGQIIADAIQIELLKKGLHFTNQESANMILTGTIVFTSASSQAISGFASGASGGSGGIYGVGSARTYINSAIVHIKDKNNNILAFCSYKVTPGWDTPQSPVWIGLEVGKKLARKIN